MVSFSVAGMRPKLAPELLPLPFGQNKLPCKKARRVQLTRNLAVALADALSVGKVSISEGKSSLVSAVLTAALPGMQNKVKDLRAGMLGQSALARCQGCRAVVYKQQPGAARVPRSSTIGTSCRPLCLPSAALLVVLPRSKNGRLSSHAVHIVTKGKGKEGVQGKENH